MASAITRAQVREIDRRAIEEYGIPGIVLMENAGRGAAEVILQRCAGGEGTPIWIYCGGGNNGGDGYVIARHAHNRGAAVQVVAVTDPLRLAGDARIQSEIVRRMGLPITAFEEAGAPPAGCIVVDALLGTGAQGAPRPPMDAAITAINAAPAMRVAIDVPSGLDCDSGEAAGPAVRADWTVTFVAPKIGFTRPQARRHTGEVLVVDIGVPRELLAAYGLPVPAAS